MTRSTAARTRRGLRAIPAITAGILALAVAPAGAAITQIGAVSEISANLPPEEATAPGGIPLYLIQVGESSGTYAVPPGYGVITAWRHRAGTGEGQVTFKVYRPTGTPGRFLVLASDARTVTPSTVNTFSVRIPVRPGDRIGISSATAPVGYVCAGQFESGQCDDPAARANQAGAFDPDEPDPQVGTTPTLDGAPFGGFRIGIAAQVETDADRDGFGDHTQDGCPGSATAIRPPCPRAPVNSPSPQAPAQFPGCPAATANVIRGTIAPDTLTGTGRGDRIFTGNGNDRVDGQAGGDCIDLGPGADRGLGGLGADLLLGGLGNDRLTGQDGADRLVGGPDADRLAGASGRDRMIGGSGRDTMSGGGSGDRIAGDRGNDRVNGNSGNDSITGNSGSDRLTGGRGGDRISGGSGRDRIAARDGRRDRISCGAGGDSVTADRFDRVARDCERVR